MKKFFTLPPQQRYKWKRLVTSFIGLILIVSSAIVLFNPRLSLAAWYNASWAYRKALVIDEAQVSGSTDLTNFPVLISRTDTDLMSNAQSDGDDILFTSSDGSTKLDHEIERYDSGTGELIAWVEIPTLDYNDNTTIYMYYGNAGAANQQNATGVWDSSYAGVWHLKESGNGVANEFADSTSNANHGKGRFAGQTPDRDTGKIGYGQNFIPSNFDGIEVNDAASLDLTGDITLSAWVNRNSTVSNYQAIIAKRHSSSPNYQINLHNASPYNISFQGGGTYSTSSTSVTASTWEYVTAVVNDASNNVSIYKNGVFQSTLTSISAGAANADRLNIGNINGGELWNGLLDEIRISSSQRSADWIATEYNNQNDPAGFLSSVSSQQVPTGNLLHLGLDEGTGTSTYNRGTDTATGTISGASWRTEESCVFTNCLYFDGTNDVVTLDTSFNVKTVAFWVRPTTATEQFIDLTGSAYVQSSSGTIAATGVTSPTIYVNGRISSSITANRWQHVVVTTSTNITADAIKIGQISTNYGQGFFDEIKMYSTTLSLSQIQSLYNARSGGPTSARFGGGNTTNLSDGLVGYWKMDESSANTCTGGINDMCDRSGNGNDGAWNGNTSSGTGKFGFGANFDGANDNVSIPHNSNNIHQPPAFTVCIWANRTGSGDANSAQTLIEKFSGVSGYQLELSPEATGVRWNVAGSGDNVVTTSVGSTTGWNHYCGTFDGTTSYLFVNGNLQGSISAQFIGNSTSLLIGESSGVDKDFQGQMDEVRIYNRALSTKEIQQIYSWAPGPVGHWKLDERVGTTVQDSSTNGNTGTLTNGPLWSTGKMGSAVLFDGNDDAINVGSNTIIDDVPVKTISMWIKLRAQDSVSNRLFEKASTGWFYASIPANSQTILFEQQYSTSNGQWATPSNSVPLNIWTHVSISYDRTGANTPEIYINGILQTLTTFSSPSGTAQTEANGDLFIGNQSGLTRSFDGSLDDVRFYNYIRTSSQVIQDMNADHPLVGTPVAGPVAHWKFDEGYGTTAQDTTPNDNDLTLNTASWANNGRFHKAWTGTGTTRMTRVDDADFDFAASEDFTIAVWARSSSATNPASDPQMLADKGDSSPSYSLYFNTSGQINFGVDDDTTFFPEDDRVGSTTDFYDGTWHHYVAVKNGTTAIRLYVDGKLIEEDTSIAATGTLANSDLLVIGSENSVDTYGAFSGTIDEMKIYRAAMTADQVLTEYNQGKAIVLGSVGTASDGSTSDNSATREYCIPGETNTCTPPVAEWKIDEGTGTTINDTSTNNYSATASGPLWTRGKLGNSLVFDGSDDYVSTSSTSIFNATTAYTLSAWIFPESMGEGSAGNILSKNGVVDFFVESNALNICYTSDSCSNYAATANNTISLNQWQHVAVTYNGSSTFTLFINGVDQTSDSTTTTPSNAAGAVVIGSETTGSTSFSFDGRIDHVRIYNYARSPAQIAWDYNRGGPVGWWKFDECSSATANDATENGRNGTITPGASGGNTATGSCSSGNSNEMWNDGTTGKFNYSLGFDGTNDYVSVADHSLLDITGDFTLSAWVKRDGGGGASIISKTNASSDGGYSMLIGGSGELYCRTTNASSFNDSYTATNAIPADGSWHHTLVVRSGTSCRVYVDGIDRTNITATHTTLTANASNLIIGSRPNLTGEFWNGQIDDARVYRYALTAKQIQVLFNENAAIRFGPSVGAP